MKRDLSNLSREERALLFERLREKKEQREGPADRIEPRPAELTAPPLSFAQQRLWFLDQLMPGDPSYTVQQGFRIRGPFDPSWLRRALTAIVARHESLRTTFSEREGAPVQVVSPPGPRELPTVDLSVLSLEVGEGETRRLGLADLARPFDLATGPLMRAALLRLAPDDHALLLSLHHIIGDGWSMGIFAREVIEEYQAGVAGEPADLPPLPIQYADYAVWQRAWLAGEVLDRQVQYWKQQLAGAPDVLDLPTDRPRPTRPTTAGGFLNFALPESVAAPLKALSRDEGTTLFITLLAAFGSLLARTSGQPDLVVGTPVAGRGRAEVGGLIGFFINTLALRVHTTGDPTFRELLARVRKTALDAYAHQDLPFEKLLHEVKPDRETARSPLFQVMLVLQNLPLPTIRLPGLSLAPLRFPTRTAKYEMTLVAAERGHGITGALEYSLDLFVPATIARFVGHLTTLLAGIAASPSSRLSALPLLSAAERHQLLAEWNDTATGFSRQATLPGLVSERAAHRPGAVAVEWEDGTMTYGELWARAASLAGRLAELGVGLEVPVALLFERSPAMIVGMLAILRAGGAYVPLDPEYPFERLALLLEDVGAPVVVTERRLIDLLPAGAAGPFAICIDADGEAESEPPWPAAALSESLAYVMYTSGSTGRPKGVGVTHRNVVRLIRGGFADLGSDQTFLQLAPASFDASTLEIWGALCNGGRLVLFPPRKPSLAEIAATVADRGVTTLWLTAGLFHPMVDAHLEALRSLRQLLAGGDVLSPAHVGRALAGLPATTLVNGYGPTEGTTFTCCHPMRGAGACPSVGDRSVPIGRPIGDTRCHILDDAFHPVPIGIFGELHAGGDGVARGYFDRPALTAERFVPDPFGAPGDRLYRTGDLARHLPDGSVEFLGRRDGQVKVRGYRVEPGEIEAALAGHSGIAEAAVLVHGETAESRRLVAYLVPREGSATDAAALGELRRFLAERLPDPLVPQLFLPLDALPLGENGKVDRLALAAIGEKAMDERTTIEAELVPPRTPVEQLLAGIWAEVLGLPLDKVGVFDSFFDLGGHSLLATQLVSRARGSFQVEMQLRALFDAPTIAGLAAAVESLEEAPGRSDKIARVLLRLQAMSPEAREALRQRAGEGA